jgi:predicted kinase
MRALAHLLADFHRRCPTGEGVDAFGAVEVVRANCEENFDHLLPFTPHVLSSELHGFLRRRADGFLRHHERLLEARVATGRIREGHGDLHAENICLLSDRIVIYDRIEFSRRFRCGDVASDVAFLLMDLDLRGYRGFAGYLEREYVRASGDKELPQLIPFYKNYRALVRAKVACLQLASLSPTEQAVVQSRARRYFHLATALELGPALVLCCGLPGSGKTFAASHVAEPFAAAVLNSDTTRKRSAGVPSDQHDGSGFEEGMYDRARSDETYALLLAAAQDHLRQERTVVVDAGFRTADRRRPFHELASRVGLPFVLIHAAPPEEVARSRLAARRDHPDSASDAGMEVYDALAPGFEPPTELPAASVLTWDGTGTPEELTTSLLERLARAVEAGA